MTTLKEYPEGLRVLLHLCCAPDASHGIPAMRERFEVTGYFFNPNIEPGEEYARRLDATVTLRGKMPFPLEVSTGGREEWEEAVRGLENEPERGRRCEECIRFRLVRTAMKAREMAIPAFGTVLTVSPKKDAAMVNRVGREVGKREEVLFVEADLKKNDGFLKSVEATKRFGIYRQRYCGCRYSFRP